MPRRIPSRPGEQSQGPPQPVTDPVKMVSEDPLEQAVAWVYVRRLTMQLQPQVTYEIDSNNTAWLNEYFYGLGGYASLVHTRLVLANDGPTPIEIGNIEVLSSCTKPADGALVDVTGLTYPASAVTTSDINLGFELNVHSDDAEASSAPSVTPATWTSGYFNSHSPPIGPTASQAFDIWVIPSAAACSFWFAVVVLDGAVKFPLSIEDDGQPFRVSSLTLQEPGVNPAAPSDAASSYGIVYVGGAASPLPNGALYRESLKPSSGVAASKAA